MNKLPAKEWKHLREVVFERDNNTCCYCGDSKGRLVVDHIIPVARGGSNEVTNLATACNGCNVSKGNRTAQEWEQGVESYKAIQHFENPCFHKEQVATKELQKFLHSLMKRNVTIEKFCSISSMSENILYEWMEHIEDDRKYTPFDRPVYDEYLIWSRALCRAEKISFNDLARTYRMLKKHGCL